MLFGAYSFFSLFDYKKNAIFFISPDILALKIFSFILNIRMVVFLKTYKPWTLFKEISFFKTISLHVLQSTVRPRSFVHFLIRLTTLSWTRLLGYTVYEQINITGIEMEREAT